MAEYIDDEHIIDLLFRRDESGISALAVKYGGVCQSLAYNIVHSWSDAEECVNDTYLYAWNCIPPHRPNPLQSFILKIVRNVSLKKYRANTIQRRNSNYNIALEEIENELSISSISYHNTVEAEIEAKEDAKELVGIIEKFIDSLSEDNQAILIRRYWLLESYDSISAAFGISKHHAVVKLSRIRKKMYKYLTERGVIL